jgi:hypothetical protein
MNPVEKPTPFIPSASQHTLDSFETTDRIADFFDQRPHRMACALCGFYRPKNSAAALFLEGKKNLLRLQQEIPLTEAEANTVVDGMNAFEKLLSQLRTFLFRTVPLRCSFRADSFRSNR